mmetsp:Transcript_23331/g.38568  ORF Transcript_23331/g.38568 Transcript_23331/m.38568 type:complete len:195 (-) Transcript_23331:38-622(-)
MGTAAEAAGRRVRGPTVQDRRMREAAIATLAETAARNKRASKAGGKKRTAANLREQGKATGGKAQKTGFALARAQLRAPVNGVVASIDRHGTMLAKRFREAEKRAREAPAGALTRPPSRREVADAEEHKKKFGEWMRKTLSRKVTHALSVKKSSLNGCAKFEPQGDLSQKRFSLAFRILVTNIVTCVISYTIAS